MRLIVYGGRGWIASNFCKWIAQNYPETEIIYSVVRLDNTRLVEHELDSVKPTHVFCSVGRTHGPGFNTIDYLEQPGKIIENVRDNLYSPISLGILCQQKNIHCSYLGTGCIFDGTNDSDGYYEDSVPDFFGSSYSIVKGYTDKLAHLLPILNLRIRMPITSDKNPRNFITKITNYEKICSIPNSMTVLETFYPIFYDLMVKKEFGTFNCTNPGLISHDEILEMYREIVDPDFKWSNFTIQEQDHILKSKRSNNFLNTDKITSKYPNLLNIRDAVKKVLENYK